MSEQGHDDLDAFFMAERAFEEAPSDTTRLRLRDAIDARIGLAGGGHGGTPPAGDGRGGAPPAGGTPAVSAGVSVARAVSGMIATFAVGAIGGAVAMNAASSPKVEAPPRSMASHAPAAVTATPLASSVVAPEPGVPVHALPSAPRPPNASAASNGERVGAERALLDAARVALSNGEPDEAVTLVERHANEFPHGRLVEESDALAVRALVKSGRYDEARARGAAFKAKWPRSLALPAVDAALASIP
jgi:hypothetical protein